MKIIPLIAILIHVAIFSHVITARADSNLSSAPLRDLVRNDRKPYFIPNKIGKGDSDFHNQVFVTLRLALRINKWRDGLEARVFMDASEGRHDWTRASGWSNWEPVYEAPHGSRIDSIVDRYGDYTDIVYEKESFRTTNSCCAAFNRYGEYLVRYWKIVADTNGNEAGTRTGVSVYFNRIKVLLKKR